MVVTCLKKRDNSSSSVPLRYIPKKSFPIKKSENFGSEPIMDLKRKDFFEFSKPSPPLKNKASHDRNFVQNNFNFDLKPRYQSELIANFNDDCEDTSTEKSEELSEEDNTSEEPKDLNTHRRYGSFEPLEHKSKNNDDEIFATRSSDFDSMPQCQSRMVDSNFLLHGVEQDYELEEPLEFSNDDDDNLGESEESDEELIVRRTIRCHEHDGTQPWEDKTTLDAKKVAVKFLAARALTTVQLRKKLSEKKFHPSIIEAVIIEFQTRGFLNDSLYAKAYCQSKWSSSTWGPRRIKQELSRKGVNKLDTDNAIQLVFKDGESDDDHSDLCHGLSKSSMGRLFVQASKRWTQDPDLDKEKRKARMIRWLQYRGFNWGVIGFVVRKLETDFQS